MMSFKISNPVCVVC